MSQHNHTAGRMGIRVAAALTVGALIASGVLTTNAEAGPRASKVWRKVAANLRTITRAEAKADRDLARVRASLLLNGGARDDALGVAQEEYNETLDLAREQYKARLDLAVALGESDIYRVVIDPADFVAAIDNPYLPFVPGNTWTYRGETEEGTETIVLTVLEETRVILGVTCTVVRDTVSIDGSVVEDTFDWYAQDRAGNVWYFGESSATYDGGLITSVEGSWETGVDGAQPGIVMKATPVVGEFYRQEFLIGEAEDYAQVLSTTATASVPFGNFTNCLQTLDALPLEPDALEHKYYAPGVGFVLELKPGTTERVELISFTAK